MKTKNHLIIAIYSLILVHPHTLFAQTNTIKSISANIVSFISRTTIPLVVVIAFSYFMWTVFNFVRSANSAEDRKKGRAKLFWGIISLFVMISFLGFTSLFTQTLFNSSPGLPQLYE